LQTEFKKFGVFGFSGLVEHKQAELHQHYVKMMWKEMVQFVSIPKIILTIALYLVTFATLKAFFPYSEIVLFALVALVFIYVIASGFRLVSRITKRQKKTQKQWLIQTIAGRTFYFFPALSFSPAYIQRLLPLNDEISVAYLHFLTAYFVLHLIAFYVSIFIIRPVLKNEIAKTEKKFSQV